MNETQTAARFLTVKQLVSTGKYPWLTEGAVRHLIFASKPALRASGEAAPGNGLARAIVRVGRKVLIDVDEFDNWLESGRQAKVENEELA
jgi:hypothetical protein